MAERALATAYVNLVPAINAKLVKNEVGKIGTSIGGAGEKAGKNFSSKFSGALKIGLAAAGTAAVAGVVGLAKSSVTAASDAAESINAINVAYGESAEGILELSEGTAKRLGVSGNDFRSAAVRFSSFTKTIAGGDSQKVISTLDELTTRATDFASVNNLEVADSLQKFQSGLAGETEPLRQFGIDLSAAAVQSFAYANGIAEQGEQLTESQKIQARYGSLLEQTQATAGDFTNTQDGFANSTKTLGATFEDIQAQLGTALLPILEDLLAIILEDVVPAVEDFAQKFSEGETPLNNFFDRLGEAITFIKENWTTIKILGGAILGVVTALSILSGVLKAVTIIQGIFNLTLLANPITWIVLAVAALVAGIIYLATQTTFFQDLWETMVTGITMAWEWFVDLFNNAVEGISTFFENVFTGIGTFFSNIINGWIGMVEGFVNFFIKGINFIIEGLNKLKFSVPEGVPFIGGTEFGLNIPLVPNVSLPRLADGGLVMPQRGGVLANIAEAGQPEVVYPLDRFEDMMEEKKQPGETIVFNNYASPAISNQDELEKAVKRARLRRG